MVIAFIVFPILSFTQTPGADKIHSYHFGTNTTFGQSPDFFPENVFGIPDTSATLFAPSSTEENVVSLGLNGWIVLEFADNLIRDFPGPDFTVFENAFFAGNDTTKIWREPGIISVSKNGIDFVEFPFDSISLSGCAGTRPTNGKVNPQDYSKSGGNQFDLSIIGMDSVRFVRIDDRSRWVLGGGGFDLDAVVAIQTVSWTIIKTTAHKFFDNNLSNYPNPFNPITTLEWNQKSENGKSILEIYSVLGEKIFAEEIYGKNSGKQSHQINLTNQSSGIYFALIKTDGKIFYKQIQLVK